MTSNQRETQNAREWPVDSNTPIVLIVLYQDFVERPFFTTLVRAGKVQAKSNTMKAGLIVFQGPGIVHAGSLSLLGGNEMDPALMLLVETCAFPPRTRLNVKK